MPGCRLLSSGAAIRFNACGTVRRVGFSANMNRRKAEGGCFTNHIHGEVFDKGSLLPSIGRHNGERCAVRFPSVRYNMAKVQQG